MGSGHWSLAHPFCWTQPSTVDRCAGNALAGAVMFSLCPSCLERYFKHDPFN